MTGSPSGSPVRRPCDGTVRVVPRWTRRPFDGAGAAVADNQSDLIILGGGSSGYAASLLAAELGKSVVLIEKDKVGGTCLHLGCIPTKALLHAGETADQAC